MRTPKKLIILCTIFMLPAFVLKLFVVLSESEEETSANQDTLFPPKLNSECAESFQNLELRKKLSTALERADPDMFMLIMKNYLPTCQLKTSRDSLYGNRFIKPRISVGYALKSNATNNISATKKSMSENSTAKALCPPLSPLLQGHINVDVSESSTIRKIDGKHMNWPPTMEELAIAYQNLQLGGYHAGPRNCQCRSYNAIIVPYRNREEHLRYFLYYIHRLLQRQQLCYIVIVSEQTDNEIFNKGQLMNTAFEYARELMPFDCYIFHDVDVIAEDDRILYSCRDDKITHYAPYIDKYNYRFPKYLTMGAAVGFTEEQFLAVNGYSNEYGGWGGEDDDIATRISIKDIPVWRSDQNYTRFRMIKHGSDPGNKINVHRYHRLREAKKRQRFDGVNSLATLLIDNIQYKTHTRLKVKTYQTGLQKEYERIDIDKVPLRNELNVGIPSHKVGYLPN